MENENQKCEVCGGYSFDMITIDGIAYCRDHYEYVMNGGFDEIPMMRAVAKKHKKMNKKDFKITYTHGTGPGGQHKNKVETCVVIKHLPTGMQEKCEDTRSKHRNKEIAMERLLKRIDEHKQQELHEKRNDNRKEQILNKKTVRTYNYPRNQVKDHRTGKKANLDKVMKGDLDLLK